MDIDLKTLFYLFSIGTYCIIFFLSVYVLYYKVKNPILYIFIASKFLYAIVWIVFALSFENPQFYYQITANILLVFAIYFDLYAIVFANKTFNYLLFKYYSIVPFICSIVLVATIAFSTCIQIVIMSFIIALLYVLGGLFLLLKYHHTKMQYLASFLCFALGFAFIFKTFWALLQDQALVVAQVGNMQLISHLFLLVASFTFPLILLLILNEKQEQQLKTINKNKTAFLSIIAHDLKGPLGTYNKLIELLLANHNTMEAKKRETFLITIYNSSKEMFNLLENLLHWTRSELGTSIAKPEIHPLKNLIKPAVLLMKNSLEIKKLTLISNYNETQNVYCDYHMIMTVIRNLLANAIKFTPTNGTITIYSKVIANTFIEITIEDTGIGITEEKLSTIFDLNFEANINGTNNETGTGLGLKLAKEYIQKNNGKIGIRSKIGNGTSVWIQLPIKKQN
jgi:signal transduction histidine kinase